MNRIWRTRSPTGSPKRDLQPARLPTGNPAFILLSSDLRQPSGWDVCRRLRRAAETHDLKIVLLTLNGAEAYRVGADGYLVKGPQEEPTPPVHAFRHPAPGILAEFRQRRHSMVA